MKALLHRLRQIASVEPVSSTPELFEVFLTSIHSIPNANGKAIAIVPAVNKMTSLMAAEYATRMASNVLGSLVSDVRFVAPVLMTECAETACVTFGTSRSRPLRRIV